MAQRNKWDDSQFEVFVRDLLSWAFGTIRKRPSFQAYLDSEVDEPPKDKFLTDFEEWFYREWDYYGDCSGEIVDSALYEDKLLPNWKDFNAVSEVLSPTAFKQEGMLWDMIHWQINRYMERHSIELSVPAYYQLLVSLEKKHGKSKISRFLWDGK